MGAVSRSLPDRQQIGRLPAEVTSFVGRRHEMAEVKQLLSTSRTVTLTGAGGVGKTRLALRVALDVWREFRDGVWLVEFATLESPDLLSEVVVESLEIQDHSSRPALQVVTDHLRDRQALVILDNCEHLVHECAVLADVLLRAAPHVQILATSRQALGISGEQTVPVPTLPLPDSAATRPSISSFLQCDAIHLFVERARAALPTFAVTEDNRDVVERICRRLDGIPLGIELAAVRLRALSVEQLLDRLDDRFKLLTAGSRAVPPRQQTLRALIDWSHALCTEKERLLWARASVFVGGLDLEAAEAVCSGDGIAREEIVDLVIALVDKSVLIREEHSSGVRYRLLETIRQYGRERLAASGEEVALQRRHRDWCQTLAIRAEQAWFGPEQVTWFTRLHQERGNLRTALDFCLATPGEAGAGLAMATALRFYWIAASFIHEGRRRLDSLLAADTETSVLRARALCVNARLAVLQSDFATARPMLDEARESGDDAVLAQVVYVSGLAALIRHDLAAAVELLQEAIDRQRALGDPMGVVNSLVYLATAHSFLGHSQLAVKLFEECLETCEPVREHWFTSYVLCVFGIEVWQQGDTARAIEMERESIRHKQPFNDHLGLALCVEVMAWIAASNGDGERAARLLGAVREIWRSVGGPLFDYLSGHHEECEAAARQQLGAKNYEAALREGVGLGLDEALACAMEESGRRARQAQEAGRRSPLSRREMEIARLVAQGMTNKEIAKVAVISQRTAEGHVDHILTKLGFNSRTQVAGWIDEWDRSGEHGDS